MYKFTTILIALLTTGMLRAQTAAGYEGLLVYTGAEDDSITRDFIAKKLPRLDSLASSMNLELEVMSVADGAPEEVTFTPSIWYQNFRGRSVYTGRYSYMDKIKTFLRTVRRLPQQAVHNEKHDVLVMETGRATIYTPVKITDLSGSLPPGLDQEKFKADALKAFAKGMQDYRLKNHWDARRNHRAMYMALYPYRDAEGKLSISAEMYSQFNCIVPIYRRFDQPFEGSWKGWKKAFARAGAAMESEVRKQLNNLAKGDALLPVPASTSVIHWADLGLALPPQPVDAVETSVLPDMKMPLEWVVDGPVEEGVPLLNFHFLAPVDYYSGEVSDLRGQLKLAAGARIGEEASGTFAIRPESLTMGDPELDDHVYAMILIADHPEASFTFRNINFVEQEQLQFGLMTQFSVRGDLEFMGIKVPVDVSSQMEPVLTEAGELRLQVYATFELRLKDNFGLDGPDGPLPAKDSMKFYMNFLLKPAS